MFFEESSKAQGTFFSQPRNFAPLQPSLVTSRLILTLIHREYKLHTSKWTSQETLRSKGDVLMRPQINLVRWILKPKNIAANLHIALSAFAARKAQQSAKSNRQSNQHRDSNPRILDLSIEEEHLTASKVLLVSDDPEPRTTKPSKDELALFESSRLSFNHEDSQES